MATQTTHFDMVKQQSAERVSVGLLNDNFDIIDQVMYNNQEKSEQLADEYNAGTTYNVGDYVRRENYIYKCNASTTGTWDSTKWDRVLITDELGGGGGSSTLAGLNDVNISSPTDGQALVYDDTTQKWVNGAGGGGSSTFAGLNDVDVAGVADKDIARYNSTTQKWEKSSDLTDLELAVSQISASTLGITNGHTILDSNGTAMAQEDDLQFASGYVEDDSGNGKTVYIEMIRISQANYDTLKANGQLKTGAKYFIYDAQPVAVNASNLPYSSTKSVADMIDVTPISITERHSCVEVSNAFRIGNLVILDFYDFDGDIPADTVWFRVAESARPSNAKSTKAWLLTDGSNYGTKTFTINTNGQVSCSGAVFRGGTKLIYTI